MKLAAVIMLSALVHALLIPSTAFAQEPEIVPVKEGAQAPFTGLLVPEGRYTELLEAEVERDRLKVELRLEKQYTGKLEPFLLGKVKDAATVEWYESPSFNRWFGFTLGVIVTGAAIWGGVEVIKATNNGR